MIIYLLVETQTTDQSKNFFARLTQLSRFRDIPGSPHISAKDVCPMTLPFALVMPSHKRIHRNGDLVISAKAKSGMSERVDGDYEQRTKTVC